MRRLSVLAALVAAFVGAALARRRGSGRRERVDLYYDDGSMVSLDGRTPESERLLGLARRALGGASTA